MKLKTLMIQLEPSYSDNAGKYTAEVEYQNEKGNVKMALDCRVSEALLAMIGPVITKFSHAACVEIEANLTQSLAEAQAIPAIESEQPA